MSPFRFLVALLTALALLLVYLDPGNPPTPIGPPASSQAPLEAIAVEKPHPTTTTSSTTTTSTIPADLVKPSTPCQEWLPLMVELGWPQDPKILERALKIMYRESRCQPGADSGPDHGLFQINQFWSSKGSNPPNWLAFYGIAPNHDALFDPATNIRAALALYQYSVEQNGDGWHPWRLPPSRTSTTTTPQV